VPAAQWERNQYAVLLSVFISFLGFSFVQPFLPLYIRELGVADTGRAALLSGLTFGIAPLFSGLLAPMWGMLADRHGVKIMVQRALLSFAVLNALMSMVGNPYQLLALRAGIGIFGGFGPMTASLVTRGAPRHAVGTAIGRLQACQILAAALGPLMGGVIADTLGIRTTFLITATLCAVAFVAITALFRESRADTAHRRAAPRLPVRRLFTLPGFLPLIAVLLLTQFVDRGLGPVIPLFVAELDPTVPVASTAGAVFSVGSLVSALAASQIGRLVGRYDARRLLPAALVCGLFGIAPLVTVDGIWSLMATRVVFGLAVGTVATLAYSSATQVVPEASRATAFGFLGSATSLATALGPLSAGALATFTLRTTFVVDTIVYAVAVGLGVMVSLRAPRRAHPADAP
jgi:DHA1 family multidrug resistance protein-like MFS transporter